jgi:hypothetical protein
MMFSNRNQFLKSSGRQNSICGAGALVQRITEELTTVTLVYFSVSQ